MQSYSNIIEYYFYVVLIHDLFILKFLSIYFVPDPFIGLFYNLEFVS